jgi:predicted Zn finger-like uncharacterized protein
MEHGDAAPVDIIRCPQCGTSYRAPGGIVGGPATRYRCIRCGHVFTPPEVELPGDAPDALDAFARVPEAGVRGRRSDTGDANDEDAVALTFDRDEPDFNLPPPPVRRRPTRADAGSAPAFVRGTPDTHLPDTALPPEPAFTTPAPPSAAAEKPMTTERAGSWLRFGVRFEAIVLIAFLGVGLYMSARPERTRRLVERIPGLDSTTGTPQRLLTQVGLTNLDGTREVLRGGRPAFIIRGRVVNNSDQPVGAIQIEARIYGPQGEVERKTIYAGTKVSLRLVRGWTPAAIDMLEKIKPPKRYRLGPGAIDDFLIIFRDVPADLSEFGCRVATAYPVVGS